MKGKESKIMTTHTNSMMGRKAESIYTAMQKNWINQEKQKKAYEACQRVRSFEEQMERYSASKAGYATINGISMPVLTA